ncbi:hypothetical protein, partial [Pseudomonas aeruginosa]|uniref:hypothetical protein n=1 Tax=Pseudomonas aeruginosa TaxID=287 RepID=UPI003D27DE08
LSGRLQPPANLKAENRLKTIRSPAHFCVFSRREHLAAAIPPLQTRLCLRLPAYSASAKVICFIGIGVLPV